MLKLLIWDVDGVLVRASWEGIFEAYKALIKAEGKDYRSFFNNIDEMKKWWNTDWHENEKRIDIKDIEKSHKIFYDIASRYIHLLPWTENILEKLLKKYKMAILTNRHSSSALKQIGPVAKFFEVIIGAEHLEKLKPNSEGVRIILMETKIARKDALMIGDMPADLIAGKTADTKTGAVIWEYGLGTDEDFAKLDFKPDYIFRTPFDFLKQLL
ncbi:HAD-IA family hydrolase [Patescibacteria group bacterium]|nr:HAD-IA family hydrolase [Patescibacteria group bacterium]MBU2632908.1 HAD-IA family hydrolase [Patescibacteria group bacterium]